jgi:hypothetical protein
MPAQPWAPRFAGYVAGVPQKECKLNSLSSTIFFIWQLCFEMAYFIDGKDCMVSITV